MRFWKKLFGGSQAKASQTSDSYERLDESLKKLGLTGLPRESDGRIDKSRIISTSGHAPVSETRAEDKARLRMKEMAEAKDQKCTKCGKEDFFLTPIGLKYTTTGRIAIHNLCSACFEEFAKDYQKSL